MVLDGVPAPGEGMAVPHELTDFQKDFLGAKGDLLAARLPWSLEEAVRSQLEDLTTAFIASGYRLLKVDKLDNRPISDHIVDALKAELGRIIIGQHEVIEKLLICIFGRGHALLAPADGARASRDDRRRPHRSHLAPPRRPLAGGARRFAAPGSADLGPSNKTTLTFEGAGHFQAGNPGELPVPRPTATSSMGLLRVPGRAKKARNIADPSGPWDVLKYGFLGAYAFVTSMLIRRFFQSDLRPSAYATAVYRITLVLLIVTVLHQVLGGATAVTERAELAVAFVVGFFPLVGLQALQRVTSRALRWFVPPVTSEYPLDQLDGFNLWYEARLTTTRPDGTHDVRTAGFACTAGTRPKMAAPTSSVGRPPMLRPSKLVSRTTTRSIGHRQTWTPA